MKKPRLTIEGRKAMTGRLFVLPFTIGFLLFFLQPAIQSIRFAFGKVALELGGFSIKFIGLANWKYIFTEDADFNKNLVSSLTSILYTVPVILIASLFFAIILNQKFIGRVFARAVFFLPVIIASGVVLSIIKSDSFASNLISSSQGMEANVTGNSFGLQEILISVGLSSDIVEYFVWVSSNLFDLMWRTGIQMIIFLAGLQTISPSLYEASAIEGASAWENFWMITIPMLSPMILVNLVYTVIDNFTDSENAVMSLVNDMFQMQKYNIASAMSWVYFVIIGLLLALILFLFSKAQKTN